MVMRPTFINFAKSLLGASAKSNYGRTNNKEK